MGEALVVEGLSVRYLRPNLGQSKTAVDDRGRLRKHEEVRAVRGVSFAVNRGEVLGIVGANGSGKTSLLSAIAQELPYDGQVLAPTRPRLVKMGRLLPSSLTGRQQIDLVVRSMRLPGQSIDESIEDAVNFADLGHEVDAPVRSFSKGMRSRLNFAVLTVGQPDVVLIDEALAVGDRRFVDRAADRVNNLAHEGAAVVVVDHSASRLKAMCDRGILLRDGKIISTGKIGDVLDTYAEKPVASAV